MGDPGKSRRTARNSSSKASTNASSNAPSSASSKAPPEEVADPPRPISFEESLEQLEAIVGRLEAGDLPLEESLELFESGIELSRRCNATLDSAERRIEILVAERGAESGDDAEGWVAQPFEAGIGDEPAGGAADGSGPEA